MGYKAYSVGKNWEEDVMQYYMNKGYATIKLSTDLAGTVFDIIAVKNGMATCIECKHTQTDKLYYKGCGLMHKRDDLDNFCSKGNDVIIFVKSDVDGTFITTWLNIKDVLKERGYITVKDCVKLDIYKDI